jgi:hypothetical protein
MADPLQPPLPQPPNWGAYVAGEDTLGYYYQEEADLAAIQEYSYDQKVTNPTQQLKAQAAVLPPNAPNEAAGGTPGIGPLSGAQFRGDTTLGPTNKKAGVANIPNALPGGATP